MDRPTCATCAAFKPSARDDDNEHGACRRRAPFVSVFVDDWCLEHVPQVAKDDHAENLEEYAELVQRQRDEINEAIQAEMNLRRAAASAPFTPLSGPVLQCNCELCAAERVKANDATLHQRIAEHLAWPHPTPPGSPGPAPEPDPQGL